MAEITASKPNPRHKRLVLEIFQLVYVGPKPSCQKDQVMLINSGASIALRESDIDHVRIRGDTGDSGQSVKILFFFKHGTHKRKMIHENCKIWKRHRARQTG